MKTRLSLLLATASMVAVCGLAAVCFAQTVADDTSINKVELVPVYEKTFTDSIVDAVFDTITVSIEKAKSMGWKEAVFNKSDIRKNIKTIQYPAVIAVGKVIDWYNLEVKEVKFLDPNGKLLNLVKVVYPEKIIKSKNGKYILIARQPVEGKEDWQGGRLYNNKGVLLRTYKDCFPIAISDDGYVIAGKDQYEGAPPAECVIYNPAGNITGRIINPYKNAGWSVAKFTEEQEYVIVGFTDLNSKSELFVYKKDGTLIFRKEIEGISFRNRETEILGSDESGIIGIVENNGIVSIYLTDMCGKIKWQVQLEVGSNMVCSFNKKDKLLVSTSYGYVWCIDVLSGEKSWVYKEKWAPKGIPHAKILDDRPLFYQHELIDNNIIVNSHYSNRHTIESRFWYASGIHCIELSNGNLVYRNVFPNEKILLLDNGILLNVTRKELRLFKVRSMK